MEKSKTIFLYFTAGGMEVCRLLAWASFVTIVILHRSFPFLQAIVIFAFAVLLTCLSFNKGWWVIQILGVQGVGFILAGAWMFHAFSASGLSSYPDQAWVGEVFKWSKNPVQGLLFFFAGIWSLLLWLSGMGLAKHYMTYRKICARFDLGLTSFFVLFLIKLLLWVKGGTQIADPVCASLVFPFLVCGLLSIRLVQDEDAQQKRYLPGYQGIGFLLSFMVTVLVAATAVLSLLFPYLVKGADAGYTLLKTTAEPLGPMLTNILRLLLVGDKNRPGFANTPNDAATGGTAMATESSAWVKNLEYLLLLGLWGLLILAGLIILGFLVWYISLWLLSKTPLREKRQNVPFSFFSRWAKYLAVLQRFVQRISERLRGYKRAVQFYSALLRWGSYSSIPHLPHETPLEYGLRLKHRFPGLSGDIAAIIEAFHKEVFAERLLNEQEFSYTRQAWRRMCSPRQWPARLKGLFLRFRAADIGPE